MKLQYKPAKDSQDPEKRAFYTDKGKLTAYSFACGYVERYETDERTDEYVGCLGIKSSSARVEARLYMEYRHYQIDYVVSDKTGAIIENEHYCADTLKEARGIVTTCRMRASFVE